MRLCVAVLVLGWTALELAPRAAEPVLADEGIPVSIAEFVALTDDVARTLPGCDAITVANSSTGSVAARGKWQISPGQLATTSDASLIVSASNERGNFVYLMKWQPDRGAWGTDWIYHHDLADAHMAGGHLAAGGAIAISPDDSTLLVPWENAIIKYDVAGVTLESLGPVAGIATIGDDQGVHVRATIAADIEFSADSSTAYVVANDGYVYIAHVGSLTWLGDPIPYTSTARTKDARRRRTFAALSRDERWLVINTADQRPGFLNLIDLERRESRLIEMPGMRQSWGVRFNYAGLNQDLLAVHGRTQVAVFDFTEGTLRPLAMAQVPAPSTNNWTLPNMARIGALAWSGDGARVIANIGSDKEWRILGFESGPPPTLKRIAEIDSCLAEWDIHAGFDVVTIQVRPTLTTTPTPSDTPTVTLTPSATPTPTSTVTSQPPSATPSASPTATAIPTATTAPSPVYLPLALNERCTPDKQRADVALVIDASSSMEQPTSAGRTKIAAAIEAAGFFLDQLQLDAGDQATIVAFNAEASLVQELTSNGDALDSTLASIRTDTQTCLVCGVDVAAVELAGERHDPYNTPVMIVLTDGLSNPRPASEAVTRAEEAREDGVVVYTIGLGNTLDFDALTQMASKPEYFYLAPDAEDLAGIYRQIAVEIPCPGKEFWGGR